MVNQGKGVKVEDDLLIIKDLPGQLKFFFYPKRAKLAFGDGNGQLLLFDPDFEKKELIEGQIRHFDR